MAMKLYDVIRKDQKAKETKQVVIEEEPLSPIRERISQEGREGPRRSNWRNIILFAAALLFLSLLFVLGSVFVHAKVTVTQRQIPFSMQNTDLDVANEKTADPGRLSFQTMVVTDSVTRQVFGSASTTSTTKATGHVVIFNQYSKSNKTIRSGTTLTAANGLKYITQSTVTVPGYTGTAKTAGSASVTVVAYGVGPTYNSTGTTFTIAGYGGTVAKSFFATSGAITGGQNGATHTLSDTDKQQAIATLQAALTEKLSRETRAQIPTNLITFPDLQFTSINTSSLVLQGNTINFPVTLQGTMVSYLMPRDLFEQAIASKAITDHLYPNVSIPDLGGITVTSVSPLPTDPNNIPSSITIAVSGQGTIITEVPQSTVQQAVLGIARGTFTSALSGIPEIDTAQYSLYPFWALYFPYKASRITIKIQ